MVRSGASAGSSGRVNRVNRLQELASGSYSTAHAGWVPYLPEMVMGLFSVLSRT